MGETQKGSKDREKSSVNAIFFFSSYSAQPLSYNAQPKVVVHCSCGAKKYSFGSAISGYILIFSGAKNGYLAPLLLVLLTVILISKVRPTLVRPMHIGLSWFLHFIIYN